MKKVIILLFVFSILFVTDAYAWKRKKRLAFEKGDLMLYVLTGYPKVPDMTVYGLGEETTDIYPVGGGLQFSINNYLSIGGEFIHTYRIKTFLLKNKSYDYKNLYFIALGKVFLHYSLRFFDLYLGGGAGYMWSKANVMTWSRDNVMNVEDDGKLYWTVTGGFRFAFGNGSPVGMFVEASFPYPLIAGGLYFRFSVF